MIDHSSNPWISKSPLKSFNVWLKDQEGKKGTLVVTSGAIYRKQNILSLEELPVGRAVKKVRQKQHLLLGMVKKVRQKQHLESIMLLSVMLVLLVK